MLLVVFKWSNKVGNLTLKTPGSNQFLFVQFFDKFSKFLNENAFVLLFFVRTQVLQILV